MTDKDELRDKLLEKVLDTPVWIEARAALLDPQSRLFGDAGGYVVRSDRWRLAGIGGAASENLIRDALSDIPTVSEAGGTAPGNAARTAGMPGILGIPGSQEWAAVQPEGFSSASVAALSSWTTTEADIFREPDGGLHEPVVAPYARIGLLRPRDRPMLDDLPQELADEFREALDRAEFAAGWVDDRPVSFCYVACQTSTLWDISINTLEGYRRRGLAGAAVVFLANLMRERGKRAVWGAHSHNRASRRLAGKLGFEPAGRLFLFENAVACASRPDLIE